jgi:hypothetical protein
MRRFMCSVVRWMKASRIFASMRLFVPTIYKMGINSLKPTPLYFYTQSNSGN